MVRLTEISSVPDDALDLRFTRSAGPGGQNVNKVATAVQLRLDLNRTQFPEPMRRRLERLAGSRLTRHGEILIEAQRFRSQERNREDAFARLAALVARAERAPRPRIPTAPSRAARQRRLDAKSHRSHKKRLRGPPQGEG